MHRIRNRDGSSILIDLGHTLWPLAAANPVAGILRIPQSLSSRSATLRQRVTMEYINEIC
jgi:hypothetical protein